LKQPVLDDILLFWYTLRNLIQTLYKIITQARTEHVID